MGPLQNVLGMLPGMPKEIRNADVDDREIGRIEAIIRSMTPEERRKPEIINGQRRMRIAKGSGTSTTDVNKLLTQFKQVQTMMKGVPGMSRKVAKGKKGKGKKGKAPKMPRVPGSPAGFREPAVQGAVFRGFRICDLDCPAGPRTGVSFWQSRSA
jgi:signal recognition particle GTPase